MTEIIAKKTRERMHQEQQIIQQDTIDLRELFAVLKRRKKMIWAVTALLTILAIIYVFIAKPVYEVKSVIELAQINKKPVLNTNDLKQKIEFVYEVNVKGKKIEYPIVKSISLPKKSQNLMVITTNGYDNNSATNKIEEVFTYLSVLQDKEVDIYIKTQKKHLHMIESDLKRHELYIANIKDAISNYQKKLLGISREDAALAGIYSIEIGKKQTEINSIVNTISYLNNKKNDIELSISPLKIHKTERIGKIEVLDKPVKPKKKLIVIVAFITGLMLSVFLAFFLEFMSGMKKEEDS